MPCCTAMWCDGEWFKIATKESGGIGPAHFLHDTLQYLLCLEYAYAYNLGAYLLCFYFTALLCSGRDLRVMITAPHNLRTSHTWPGPNLPTFTFLFKIHHFIITTDCLSLVSHTHEGTATKMLCSALLSATSRTGRLPSRKIVKKVLSLFY